MGKIIKFDIGRLEQRNPELHIDCPNCGTARIKLPVKNANGINDVRCPKCEHRIIVDSLNITVVREGIPDMKAPAQLANVA